MIFLRIGSRLINLERVQSINLEAPSVQRRTTSTGVQVNFGGMDVEVFQSHEAEALRAFLTEKANGRCSSCGSNGVEIVKSTAILEFVEVV